MPLRLTRRGFMGLAASGAVAACRRTAPSAAAGAGGPIRIGVMLPFSGPPASISKEVDNGIVLGFEGAGMKAGGRALELVKEDDRNDASYATQAIQRLLDVEKVHAIIGPGFSHVLLAIRKLVHDTKTILVTPNSGPVQLAGDRCSRYVFNVSFANPMLHEAMGGYLARKRVGSVTLVAPNYTAGADMMAGFKATYTGRASTGGKIADELLPALNTLDFAPYLSTIRSKKPDAVYAFMPGSMGVAFVKQYDQAGLKALVPLYATGWTVEEDLLPAQGSSALGIVNTCNYAPSLDNAANKVFATRYKAKYGSAPSSYAMQAYDAARLLVAGLDAVHGNTDDKDALIAALERTSIESPRGPFKLGPNRTPVQDVYLREVASVEGTLTNKVLEVVEHGYFYAGEGCALAPSATP